MRIDVEHRWPAALTRWAGAALRAVAWCAAARRVRGAFDALDEQAARRARVILGRRRCLLSWERDPDGRWRARLSGPDLVRTIERTGRTRRRAIARSARALDRLPALRARLAGRARRRLLGGRDEGHPR